MPSAPMYSINFCANLIHFYLTCTGNTYSILKKFDLYKAYSDDNSALCSHDLKIAVPGVSNKSVW